MLTKTGSDTSNWGNFPLFQQKMWSKLSFLQNLDPDLALKHSNFHHFLIFSNFSIFCPKPRYFAHFDTQNRFCVKFQKSWGLPKIGFFSGHLVSNCPETQYSNQPLFPMDPHQKWSKMPEFVYLCNSTCFISICENASYTYITTQFEQQPGSIGPAETHHGTFLPEKSFLSKSWFRNSAACSLAGAAISIYFSTLFSWKSGSPRYCLSSYLKQIISGNCFDAPKSEKPLFWKWHFGSFWPKYPWFLDNLW